MRLSSKKAAYVVVDESSVVGNPEFARDDKGEGSAHLNSGYRGMDGAAAGYPRFSSPRVKFANATNLNRKSGVVQWRPAVSPFSRRL
jgi:hypothetical protein